MKLIVIVGPTASGKSGLAVSIAHKHEGEIVSADSRQIYKELDIGTAKITKEEMSGIPHHLIDVIDIGASYSAEDFKNDAKKAIAKIIKNGHLPIIAGGTFFYIDTLLGNSTTAEVPPNEKLRAKLSSVSTHDLYQRLKKKDAVRAGTIDAQNPRRLIRALEIVDALGAVPNPSSKNSDYEVLTIGIETPKEELRARLRERAKSYLTNGFKNEVESLLQKGISLADLQEIGFEYQLGVDLVKGTLSEDSFVEAFEQKNWQYAKRQLTWLKKDRSIHWISLADKQEVEMLISQFLLKN